MRSLLRWFVAACIVAQGASVQLSAQTVPRWVESVSIEVQQAPARRRYTAGDRFVLRTAAGAGLGALGAIGIGVLGSVLIPDCSNCEDPGLEEAVWSVLVGWTIGSGLGAALPALDGRCTTSQRRLRGLLGAGVAALAGVVYYASQDDQLDSAAGLALVLPAPIGGALGVMTCEGG